MKLLFPDDQLACLMRFLTTHYGYKKVIWYKLPEIHGENNANPPSTTFDAIALWKYKLEEVEHGEIGMRWKSNDDLLNEIKAKIYHPGEKGFVELHKCADILYRER